jgi:hypothetical protein
VVEHGRLGGASRTHVVVAGDRVQELGGRAELLEGAQPEVDVAQQASLIGRREERRPAELLDAADVVDERRGDEQVGRQSRVDLGQLAGERRDADRVLEQAACIRVVAVGCRGVGPEWGLGERTRNDVAKPFVVYLGDEELEEALELGRISAHPRRQLGGIDVGGRLERPHLDLELVAEPLDPPEHADCVTGFEASVEQVDVVPDSCPDSPARVYEFEGEVRRAVPGVQPLLARDCVDALDRAVWLELRDGRHEESFAWQGRGIVAWMRVERNASLRLCWAARVASRRLVVGLGLLVALAAGASTAGR